MLCRGALSNLSRFETEDALNALSQTSIMLRNTLHKPGLKFNPFTPVLKASPQSCKFGRSCLDVEARCRKVVSLQAESDASHDRSSVQDVSLGGQGLSVLPISAALWLFSQLPAGAEELAQTESKIGDVRVEEMV